MTACLAYVSGIWTLRDLALAQQNHSDHIKYLRVEMQLPSDINKKASWYMPKLIMTVYAAYVSGISSDILSGILSDISSQLLCGRGPARITFIQQLLFRSGGDHCDRALAVEVRRGPLWSGACCSGPSGTTPITSLAVEVRRGTLWSWACCSGPAGTTAITSLQLRSAEEEKKEEASLHKIEQSSWQVVSFSILLIQTASRVGRLKKRKPVNILSNSDSSVARCCGSVGNPMRDHAVADLLAMPCATMPHECKHVPTHARIST